MSRIEKLNATEQQMIVNEGKRNEVTLRVVLSSDENGREYFTCDSLDDALATVKGIVERAIKDKQPIERLVAIAIVPKDCYGSDDGYGYGLGD